MRVAYKCNGEFCTGSIRALNRTKVTQFYSKHNSNVTYIEMTQHVLSSGATHELRPLVAGDDVGCASLIISRPESQMKVHLFALCPFIHTCVKHDNIWFLTNAAR